MKQLRKEYVLIQAWKKTAAYIRRHNWFSDTLELDLAAADLESFIKEIRTGVRSPAAWESSPLRLVLAPKKQDWFVQKECESTGDGEPPPRWTPRPDTPCGKPTGVSGKLRPLAHVALRDQVVATALMLCLANRVETQQGDPRRPKGKDEHQRTTENRVSCVSYGNRLFCDREAGKLLRHRWGATKLYRGYYEDYKEFLARPQRAAEREARRRDGQRTFIVQADLSRFYDRVRPRALKSALESLKRDGDDDAFFELAGRVLNWEWHEDDRCEIERYRKAGEITGGEKVALPQGLVSAGFWANVALLKFDEELRDTQVDGRRREQADQARHPPGLRIVDACRYVDDIRLVVTTIGAEKEGKVPEDAKEEVREQVMKKVGEWVQELLNERANGHRLNPKKTAAVEIGADTPGSVVQSRRMNRIQTRVSGGFSASEGLELLESIQGLLMIRESFTRECDRSHWKHAPKPDVPEDTRARFGAFRYRRVIRDIRAMLPAKDDSGAEEVRARPGTSVITRLELDERTREFAYVLVQKWVHDPSNVRILLIALDLWPEAELLESVLGLLRPWNVGSLEPAGAQRVAWYCLSEVFRAGSTETGLRGDPGSRPDGLCLKEYRRLLFAEAWEVVERTEPVLPWYLRQQALLLLFSSESYSPELAGVIVEEDPKHFRRMAELLAARPQRTEGDRDRLVSPLPAPTDDEFAKYSIVLYRCFQRQVPAARWTPERIEAIAKRDPGFARCLLLRRDGNMGGCWRKLARQLLVDRARFDPQSLARLVMERDLERDEPALLDLTLLLIKALAEAPAGEAVPPWRLILKRKEGTEEPPEEGARDAFPWESASISDQEPCDSLGLWEPPAFCDSSQKWSYQLGYLLRFVLARRPDFTANVDRRRRIPEPHYRSAVSSWAQRKYGNYDGQSAFGGDWLPITDWLERFLSALLWWPGRKKGEHRKAIAQGIENTRTWVKDRIGLLDRGEATGVQFLPMAFSSSYLQKELKTLRGCVVQTTYPAEADFEGDLTLSADRSRARHRKHLTNALALVRQAMRLKQRKQSRDNPVLDLLVLPELSVHPEDVRRYLMPFSRAFKTIILAGVVFEELRPETKALVNTAVWIVPEYTLADGWNVRSRRQGKQYLAAHERKIRDQGRRVNEYRPCQWIIECPSSLASVKPLRLSASVCYDATDLGIASDLRKRSDVYLIPALNKDVRTFDNMAISLSYQMYQLVVVANNGRYGGSSAYWPIGKRHERRIMHLHGADQPTLGFFGISDVVAYRRGRVEDLPGPYEWKEPPAGFEKKKAG